MKRVISINLLQCGVFAFVMAMPGHAAAGPEPLTMERAVALALLHNPELQASDARKEAAAGRAMQAPVWQNPEIEFSVEDMPARSSGFSKAKNMVGIYQTVPYPGKKRLDKEIGASDAVAGEAGWRLHRAELARDVKIAFCRALAAGQSAKVSADLVELAGASAAAARKRAEAGDTAFQEQLRAEIQMEQAKAELSEAEREVAAARQELAFLSGVPATQTAVLAGVPDDSPESPALGRGPGVWLASHPAMVAARAKVNLTGAALRRAQIEGMPDPKVGISGGHDGAADENLVELRLTLPLPLIDRGKGRTLEARAGVREAEAQLAATEQRLLAEWRAAVTRFKTAAAQVATQRNRILPKCEEALRLVRTGFEQGKFGFIDLLDTQRTTAEARLIYQKKLFELNVARAELESLSDPVPAPPVKPSKN